MGLVVPDVGLGVAMRSARWVAAVGLAVLCAVGCGDEPTDDEPTDLGIDDDMAGPNDGSTPEDAGPPDLGPEPCDVEGETRAVECGNCGLGQERCEEGVWVLGECLNEKECTPGELEDEDLGMCATRARICGAECEWGEWDMTAEAGECEVGEMRMWADGCEVDEVKSQMCSATCEWTDVGVCTGGCSGTRRTSPLLAEEVCVPAGSFIRGDDDFGDAAEAEVMLTYAYFIDKSFVTNGRYRECVDAGACTELPSVLANYNDPTLADYPAGAFDFEAAQAFCEWDGRRLPTVAEWEKAARGPAPRAQPWTWEGDSYRCDLLPSLVDCADPTPPPTDSMGVEQADRWPGTESYYGVNGIIGISQSWVSDWYGENYYSDPASRLDPVGPATGTQRSQRGSERYGSQRGLRIGARIRSLPTARAGLIRCARTAP